MKSEKDLNNHGQPSNEYKAPTSIKEKLSMVGPGLAVAATGVGTADMITAIVLGTSFGMTFVWAIIVGSVLKYFLNEGVGRWYLATGKTILEGWRSLGSWATGYFSTYSIIWGFVYGAAAAATCGMAMEAMFPIMPIWGWAIVHSVVGFLLVFSGRYLLFERIMTVLIAIMFITIIGTAALFLPSIGDFAKGFIPAMPDGSFMMALGLIGGVGGTITMASYGYWLKEKKWEGKSWISVMRTDSKVAYTVTAIFTVASLIIGAQFLMGTGVTISGDQGLVTLAQMLGDEFGTPLRWLFLIAFWSAAFSSLLGVWNGVPYLFADFIRLMKARKDKAYENKSVEETDPAYRFYLAWLSFPPLILLFFGKPVQLIIIYGALGALFMPFLAISLVVLLNSKKVQAEFRNKWLANTVLIGCVIMFVFLAINQLMGMF
jgi:Mn2+/Fe2+ NRAMP family transporter